MKKRIMKKHMNIAAKVYDNAFGGSNNVSKYYTWKRSKFIARLMRAYYDVHYYYEDHHTRDNKYCFW